ncbi:hypothetical protein ACP4OV_002419 [Aristida adscensionis]
MARRCGRRRLGGISASGPRPSHRCSLRRRRWVSEEVFRRIPFLSQDSDLAGVCIGVRRCLQFRSSPGMAATARYGACSFAKGFRVAAIPMGGSLLPTVGCNAGGVDVLFCSSNQGGCRYSFNDTDAAWCGIWVAG